MSSAYTPRLQAWEDQRKAMDTFKAAAHEAIDRFMEIPDPDRIPADLDYAVWTLMQALGRPRNPPPAA